MDIIFANKKLEKNCNDYNKCQKEYGKNCSKKIAMRLAALRAARVLEDIRNAPGRLHELQGDKKGQLAIDLEHPFRLIIEPSDDPIPYKSDGGLDWSAITKVKVLEIEDYH